MPTNHGGFAFPSDREVPTLGGGGRTHAVHDSGMTLRDYFAAKAMQAFRSRPDLANVNNEAHAEIAYGAADAMLKAREVKP